MVIPAELFQVNYAAETRLFLSNSFSKITLVTFKKLLFDGIQQETILFLGERGGDTIGINVVELESADDLSSVRALGFFGCGHQTDGPLNGKMDAVLS